MRPKMYSVHLTESDRQQLTQWSHSYRHSDWERQRARILLLTDEAEQADGTRYARTDAEVAALIQADALTVSRVRKRFCERGLQFSVFRKVQQKRKERILDGAGEAHLIALTCSAPPEGYKRWSLFLLKDALIAQQITDTISHETVRQTLKKMISNPG
jgi:Homeodomain-like domain